MSSGGGGAFLAAAASRWTEHASVLAGAILATIRRDLVDLDAQFLGQNIFRVLAHLLVLFHVGLGAELEVAHGQVTRIQVVVIDLVGAGGG